VRLECTFSIDTVSLLSFQCEVVLESQTSCVISQKRGTPDIRSVPELLFLFENPTIVKPQVYLKGFPV